MHTNGPNVSISNHVVNRIPPCSTGFSRFQHGSPARLCCAPGRPANTSQREPAMHHSQGVAWTLAFACNSRCHAPAGVIMVGPPRDALPHCSLPGTCSGAADVLSIRSSFCSRQSDVKSCKWRCLSCIRFRFFGYPEDSRSSSKATYPERRRPVYLVCDVESLPLKSRCPKGRICWIQECHARMSREIRPAALVCCLCNYL